MTSKWEKPRGGNNLVLDSEDGTFFISYNPEAGNVPEMEALTELANLLSQMGGIGKEFTNREEETALVLRRKEGGNIDTPTDEEEES